ncbi:hypothetical protein [Streptomyces sp. B21-083]|uniref:hypothetical protein n=1 Tax=Streptomyces sp. B21-083 TaxID=3039410 RepID=UPI002FF18DBF
MDGSGTGTRTIDAYGRGLAEYLLMSERESVDPVTANPAHIAVYVRELRSRPHPRGANVISIDSGTGLANSTIQQRLVPVHLFYDLLMEEGLGIPTPPAAAGTPPLTAAEGVEPPDGLHPKGHPFMKLTVVG